jgi:hypothetical protein
MRNKLLRKTLVIGITVLFVGLIIVPSINSQINLKQKNTSTGLASFNPFKEGWQYRKKITINHNMVDGNLASFPVLVSTTDNDLRDKAQIDGDDILFMDDKGKANPLFHEIEYFDGSSGELVAWVNIPSLFNSVDTVFYMYYGNLNCASQEFPEMVWDSNYIAVWHMNDLTDSTAYGINLINIGADSSTDGKIGDCHRFVKANADYMYHPTFLDIIPASDKLTFECWAYHLSDPGQDQHYCSKSSIDSEDRIIFRRRTSTDYLELFAEAAEGGNKFCTDTVATTDYAWHYQVGVYQAASALKIYRNTHITTGQVVGAFVDGSDHDFEIGRWYTGVNYMDGYLDEVRVSDTTRNQDWIETSYNTMNDPSSFLTIGPEEPKNRAYINTPFLYFLQNHPNLFPILQKILCYFL